MNRADQTLQQASREYVNENVYFCATHIVTHLLETGFYDYEEIENLYPIWEDCDNARLLEVYDEMGGPLDTSILDTAELDAVWRDELFEEDYPQWTGRDLTYAEWAQVAAEYDGDLADYIDRDAVIEYIRDNFTPDDIFEWWAVSDAMIYRLKQAGEPILNDRFWGRGTTGQAIYMDGVIMVIVDHIRKEAAQPV